MSTHPFDALTLENGTKLFFTPCPGLKGVDLTTSLKQLKEGGVDVLLSMMPAFNLEKEGVSEIGDICKSLGVSWFHLPVVDDCAPEEPFENAWAAQKNDILALLKAGKSIAVHCKGGTGRTGLMNGILLAELGYDYDELKQLVQSVRPKSLQLECHTSYLKAYVNKVG